MIYLHQKLGSLHFPNPYLVLWKTEIDYPRMLLSLGIWFLRSDMPRVETYCKGLLLLGRRHCVEALCSLRCR